MSARRFLGITAGAIVSAFLLAMLISRVSAATFDSSVVPNSVGTLDLGAAAGDWRSINDTIFFSGHRVGIGTSIFVPAATLHVQGDVKIDTGNLYFNSDSYGPVFQAPDASCWRVAVDNSGALSTVSTACL